MTYTRKIVITPVDHFTGARFSWRGWRANVAEIATDEIVARCDHDHGHRTTDAAIKCGHKLFRAHAAR